jgi:hypothetical protein
MADPPWYAPGFKGEPSTRSAATGEPLWHARNDGLRVDARLLEHHSENPLAVGVEFQILHDGELAYARRWPTRALALLR